MRKPYDPFLRVLVKRPGLPLRAEVVENTLRSMQELVDGPIECVTVAEDLAIVCNEEGRIRGLSPSASILRMQFVGPVAFVGVRGEEFMSITRKGERLVRQIVKEAEILAVNRRTTRAARARRSSATGILSCFSGRCARCCTPRRRRSRPCATRSTACSTVCAPGGCARATSSPRSPRRKTSSPTGRGAIGGECMPKAIEDFIDGETFRAIKNRKEKDAP